MEHKINSEMVGYWEDIAKIQTVRFNENIWKKAKILSKLLAEDNFVHKTILEIGVGLPLVSAAIQLVLLNNWQWVGTDVSPTYAKFAQKKMQSPVVHADVLSLPEIEGGFDRIFCFDSLEHVPPKDREKGFERIGRVMKEHSRIYLHLPWEESHHDPDWDYSFGLRELALLTEKTGTDLIKYELYGAEGLHNEIRKYKWVILER